MLISKFYAGGRAQIVCDGHAPLAGTPERFIAVVAQFCEKFNSAAHSPTLTNIYSDSKLPNWGLGTSTSFTYISVLLAL